MAVIVVALAAAVFWIVENSVEIGEALQGTACRVWCPPLTPQELRLRVVKAHLHLSLASNMKWHDYGGKFQLALLPEMTEQDVIRGIAEGTLLETLTTRGTVLGSHAQIDC